jgi:hypothetical protein
MDLKRDCKKFEIIISYNPFSKLSNYQFNLSLHFQKMFKAQIITLNILTLNFKQK